MPTFASAPAQYATADENQFRNAVSLALTSAQSYTNQKAAAAQAAAQAYADTNFYNKVYIDANFLPIGGSSAGTVQALTAGSGLSMTPSGTFNGSVARTLAVTGAPWSGITGTPTSVSGYGITDVYTKTASDARYAALAGPFPWADLSGTPTTLAGYGITDAAAGTAGVANSATKLATARNINGVAFDGTADITLSAAAAAADVTHGTFGSATSDTGLYKFPSGSTWGVASATIVGPPTNALDNVLFGASGVQAQWSVMNLASGGQFFATRYNGTSASPTAIGNAQNIGNLGFGGYDGTATTIARSALIQATSTQAFTSSAHGTKLTLGTVPNGSTTLTTALTLDQDQSATLAGNITQAGVSTLFTQNNTTVTTGKSYGLNSRTDGVWEIFYNSGGVQLFQLVGSTLTATFAGAVSMGGLNATTGTFSGLINGTLTGQAMRLSGSGTSFQYFQMDNTGADNILGIESSTGGSLFTGSSAYATVFGPAGATALDFGTNATVRLTIASGGAINALTDFSVATSKFTVASSSGNTAVAGTLGITGLATANGGLTVVSGQTLTLTGATVTGLAVAVAGLSPGTFGGSTAYTFPQNLVLTGTLTGVTALGSSGAATLDSGAVGSSFGGVLNVVGNLTVATSKLVVTASSGNLASAGTVSHFGSLNAAPQTTVSGSTSGNIVAAQPEQGTHYKRVLIYANLLVGTAVYTYPTAFTQTPVVIYTNGAITPTLTAGTSVTITGAGATGFCVLEGY